MRNVGEGTDKLSRVVKSPRAADVVRVVVNG